MIETAKKDSNFSITRLYPLLLGLILVAGLLIMLRQASLHDDLAYGDNLWQLELDIRFNAIANKSMVQIGSPATTPFVEAIKQTISHPGMRLRQSKTSKGPKRGIQAVAVKDGRMHLHIEYHIQQSSAPKLNFTRKALSTKLIETYLLDDEGMDLNHPQVQAISNKINVLTENQQEQLDHIFQFSRSIKLKSRTRKHSVADTIKRNQASIEERARVFVALTREMKIPSRIVTGFILKQTNQVEPHYWAEAYVNETWLPFDTYYGYSLELPENYVPFRYNSSSAVNLIDGNNLSANYNIQRISSIHTKNNQRFWYNILDLTRLDLETRTVLASLLLLPFGVLITVIFRHFVGIHSFGVFTPTLLALAVTHNQWQTSLVILSVIIILSVLGRQIFPRSLTRTPRLAIIFTLVVISMAIGVSTIDHYIPSPDGYAVLLPIVILTSLIDRFFLTLDDKGTKVAYIRLFWTIVITISCIPIVLLLPLGHLLVNYPESHLITLSVVLFITHYQGRTLAQYVPPLIKEARKSSNKE